MKHGHGLSEPYGAPRQYRQRAPYPLPAAPEETRAVRPHSPYGPPQSHPGGGGPGVNTRIAGLEAELEQLRRTMGQHPPEQR
ncbi:MULTISPECIES: hypothetical protein [unclassified Streptosporangium]|uniref:hypothetical protein n=1 Tax=unclassified Streptosporangium TaxID=2632669 RepID=UPI002E2DB338|nr:MULTISPECIES: hypothetical protein [unclassified Streptosporangium]